LSFIKLFSTPHSTLLISNYDLIVASPSVPLSHEIYRLAHEHGVEIYGEVELGARLFDGLLIGVTGTNGKTTVTRLIGNILSRAGIPALVCGNIGVSFAEAVVEGAEVKGQGLGAKKEPVGARHALPQKEVLAQDLGQGTPCHYGNGFSTAVVELSSFQLESIVTLKPDIAVITNITPDHLDRHGTFESYAAAKLNIVKNQTAADTLILSGDDISVDVLAGFCPASDVLYTSVRGKVRGAYLHDGTLYYMGEPVVKRSEICLKGDHNIANCLFAICAAKLRGVPNHIVAEVLAEFEPDDHRIKFVGCVDGKNYFNDSKGTNIGATLAAARAMNGATALILGGKDKGYEFDGLFANLPAFVAYIIALGETSGKICAAARRAGFSDIQTAPSLESAVKAAAATNAQNILLSPACSSFDIFAGYEERGRAFEEIVRQFF